MNGKKLNSDSIIALAAMLTAVVAVVVAVVQTSIMREEAAAERDHARLSVMPAISVLYSNGATEQDVRFLEINIYNQGLGPARIEDFSIYYKGEKIENQRKWVELVAGGSPAIANLDPSPTISNSYAGEGRIVPAGEVLTPIHVRHTELALMLEKALADTQFEICVCSFYDDCQRLIGLNPRPEPVQTCVDYRNAKVISRPFAG